MCPKQLSKEINRWQREFTETVVLLLGEGVSRRVAGFFQAGLRAPGNLDEICLIEVQLDAINFSEHVFHQENQLKSLDYLIILNLYQANDELETAGESKHLQHLHSGFPRLLDPLGRRCPSE